MFRFFLKKLGFYLKKVFLTKINICSKDAECNIGKGFSLVSCDFFTYKDPTPDQYQA